jgi:uncharacterized protein YaaR (DUF327 family)
MATPAPPDSAQPLLVMTLARGASAGAASIAADAVVQEVHTGQNTITDHPVEEGFNPSDHSRPEPDRLQVEMYVSDTPLSIEQTQRAQKFMQQAGIGTILSPGGNNQIADVVGYSRAVRDRLHQYRVAGTLVTVTTAIKTYVSMAIESIAETRTAQDAEAFHATVTFKFIRVVQNKLTRRVVSKDTRVGSKVKTGNKTVQKDAVPQSQLDKGYENAQGKTGVNAVGAFISGVFGGGG